MFLFITVQHVSLGWGPHTVLHHRISEIVTEAIKIGIWKAEHVEVTDLEKIIHTTAHCSSEFPLENNRSLLHVFLKKACDQLSILHVHVVIKCASVQQFLLLQTAVCVLFMPFLLSVMQITLFFTFLKGVFSLHTQTYPLAYAPTPRTDTHKGLFSPCCADKCFDKSDILQRVIFPICPAAF